MWESKPLRSARCGGENEFWCHAIHSISVYRNVMRLHLILLWRCSDLFLIYNFITLALSWLARLISCNVCLSVCNKVRSGLETAVAGVPLPQADARRCTLNAQRDMPPEQPSYHHKWKSEEDSEWQSIHRPRVKEGTYWHTYSRAAIVLQMEQLQVHKRTNAEVIQLVSDHHRPPKYSNRHTCQCDVIDIAQCRDAQWNLFVAHSQRKKGLANKTETLVHSCYAFFVP